jgi:hypothetical protein
MTAAVFLFTSALSAQVVSITGKVIDSQGGAIQGAQIRLVVRNLNAVSDNNGVFALSDNTQAALLLQGSHFTSSPQRRGTEIVFGIEKDYEPVSVSVYNATGKMVFKALEQSLQRGIYAVNPLPQTLPAQLYFVKFKAGIQTSVFSMPFISSGANRWTGIRRLFDGAGPSLAKAVAVSDTILATKSGYIDSRLPINAYTGSYTITLTRAPFFLVYPQDSQRVFKSPGGTIMFQWNALAGATGYAIMVDGNNVADSIPASVTCGEVVVTTIAAAPLGTSHTWNVVAHSATGDKASSSGSFAIAEAVDGTTGAPLGGAGSGAVKFCPWNGQFAFQSKTPAGQENYNQQPNWKFSLYTKRGTAVVTSATMSAAKRTYSGTARYDDDAIFPVEYANFGHTNNVSVTLTAFAPFNLSDQTKMTWPVAFYHMTLRNMKSDSADAACAFQISTGNTPTLVSGKGFTAEGGAPSMAVFVKSSDPAAVVTVGNDGGFLTSGALNNTLSGTTNMVASKVKLGPGEIKDIEFVLSWYKSDDPTGFYYANSGNNAQFFAQAGLDNYSVLESHATQFVERFRASNVPDWIVNTTLDQTTWTNSSIYTKDGRYSEWEGVYAWFGQMDQGWHAFGSEIWRISDIMFTLPRASEMEFWGSTEMVGGDNDGQISHDFTGGTTDHKTCLWDAPGYHGWGGPNWADLDCGFLFGVYESFVATGNKMRMDAYWPYFQRTARRLYKMASNFNKNTTYPFTFSGTGATYDKGPMDHDLYNSGLALTAFKIIAEMANVYGNTGMRDSFTTAYNTGITSFRARYLANPSGSFGSNEEPTFAGLAMSLYFHKDQMFADADINNAITYLNGFWNPISNGMAAGANDGESQGWVPYVLGHLGLAYLNTNHVAEWRAFQKDFYNRYFENSSRVFNGNIYLCYEGLGNNYASNDWSGSTFYVSLPVVWRTYYSLIGFWYNAYTNELYVEPKLPSTTDKWDVSMNHVLKNAFFCTPANGGNYGTISYTESGTTYEKQNITVRFDKPQKVSAIYISDRFPAATTPTVTVNGAAATFTRVGSGTFDRRVKINWSGTVDSTGVLISAGD